MNGKCPVCGAPLENGSCGYCGYLVAKKPEQLAFVTPVQQQTEQPQISIQNQHFINAGFTPGVSKKSKISALLLCVFFGFIGAHQFYVGRIGLGLLYLFTIGLAGLGWIVDIFRIATGSFKDEFDLPVRNGGAEMGFLEKHKDQFLDVIEFEDKTNKLIVSKFQRESGDNELKQGSKVIVREGQCAIFLNGGSLADVLTPGTYSLKTKNFPLLTKMMAFPFLFNSPVISDVYFVSTKQFVDNKWATKNPIVKRDEELSMVRIRAFGKFGFKISDPAMFMREVFGSKGIVMSYDIVQYLSSMVTEAFTAMVGESSKSILDLSSELRNFSSSIQDTLNKRASKMGIQFSDIVIENISLPDEVEKLMDERSGVGMVQKDMASFVKYQTARAMREASEQEAGIAGLGAGFALGKTLAQNIENADNSSGMPKGKVEQLRELKALLDEGILTQEEFDIEKKDILKK